MNHENELSAKLLPSQLCILPTLDEQNSCISALKSTEILILTLHYSRHFIAVASGIKVLKSRNVRRKDVQLISKIRNACIILIAIPFDRPPRRLKGMLQK
jgi:hypothetical protein